MPHSLPESGGVQEERSEILIQNIKGFASILLEQPVVMRQEWKVLMSHHGRTVPGPVNALALGYAL